MTNFMDRTLRLYRRSPEGLQFIWVYGFENGNIHIDSGLCGKMADRKQVPATEREKIALFVQAMTGDGFSEVDEEGMTFMEIVFPVAGDFADDAEFQKRNELVDSLDEFLALTGQGFVDGASSGMGTMEVAFMSADAETSKSVIADWLSKGDWNDFQSIEAA
ncbi:hypothetical protein [Jannaschia donghaensis]|uniref:Uncharacterized protein n=1 Tax=Jannaschia donghaensis TaxID=420998 RepID=A0A0M6YJM5_9RHOB|nr:hypothetical protein [Jannaschia donghaensis]CTQ49865.1 hypothetical protein JDO7802_01882 [Jannaschia donghaensis]